MDACPLLCKLHLIHEKRSLKWKNNKGIFSLKRERTKNEQHQTQRYNEEMLAKTLIIILAVYRKKIPNLQILNGYNNYATLKGQFS